MSEQQVPVDKIFASYSQYTQELTEKYIMTQAALSEALKTIDELNALLDENNKDNK